MTRSGPVPAPRERPETVIADWPPEDGREWDAQCARCGSSAERDECEQCGGEGYDGHECGEDSCCCAFPEENDPCGQCGGVGGWMRCVSSRDWCEANPLPGREQAHGVEWFVVPGRANE